VESREVTGTTAVTTAQQRNDINVNITFIPCLFCIPEIAGHMQTTLLY
jgi:hypothetical protein